MLRKRILSAVLSIILVVGLMPAPAFAGGLSAGTLSLLGGSQDNPAIMRVGGTYSGFLANGDDWYSFTTSSRHSVYSIQLTSKTPGTNVICCLYDSYGNQIAWDNTSTTRTDKHLLASDTTYKLKISVNSRTGTNYDVLVSEIPSNPQYAPLGLDRNKPYALKLATPVNSQFTDRSGSQDQWYTFHTTNKHSSYAIKLFSRMNNQSVTYHLYDSYGNQLDWNSTSTVRTDNYLLSTNSTYMLKLSANYYATNGFASYELTVSEVPSNPQYASLGKDRNNPYKLTLNKAVSSQFDDRTGSQEQWFTFSTGSKKLPTFITLTNKSKTNTVTYNLYDMYGNRIDWNSTSTKRTDGITLSKNTQYTLKINGSYYGNSGFTSYQLKVFQAKPGSVSKPKVKSKSSYYIEPKWGASSNANEYQVGYKKASAKKWKYVTTSNRSYAIYSLAKNTKYQFKVRGVYRLNNTSYYGSWSKVLAAKTKKR